MARVRETGFYFEPIAERLALLIEGAPFPTPDAWAWIGDSSITAEQAKLECAVRWPGVDPDLLHAELDLGMNALLAELEAKSRAENIAMPPAAPAAPDVEGLLSQARELQAALETLGDGQVNAAQLAAQAEALELARAAAAITGAARRNQANRELQELLDAQEREEAAEAMKKK